MIQDGEVVDIPRRFHVGDKVSVFGQKCVIVEYVKFVNVCQVKFENGKTGIFEDGELQRDDS